MPDLREWDIDNKTKAKEEFYTLMYVAVFPNFGRQWQAGFLCGGAPEAALAEIQEAASVEDVMAQMVTCNQLTPPALETRGKIAVTEQLCVCRSFFLHNLAICLKNKTRTITFGISC